MIAKTIKFKNKVNSKKFDILIYYVLSRLKGYIQVNKYHKVLYRTANSCIVFLPSIDSSHLITVDGLSKGLEELHPVQEAMVRNSGAQCGFCTPGFVMSMYGLFLKTKKPNKSQILNSIQGNLCRCTGYGPIINAAKNVIEKHKRIKDELYISNKKIKEKLIAIRDKESFPYSVPKDLKSFKSFIRKNKNNTIISVSYTHLTLPTIAIV